MIRTADHVACAVRRPELVWRSWWNRREGLNEDGTGPGADWWRVWELMRNLLVLRKVHFIPIDHDSRDARLKAFGEAVGREFSPDWSVVINKGSRNRGVPPEIDFSGIYEIPIIQELYG